MMILFFVLCLTLLTRFLYVLLFLFYLNVHFSFNILTDLLHSAVIIFLKVNKKIKYEIFEIYLKKYLSIF